VLVGENVENFEKLLDEEGLELLESREDRDEEDK